MNKYNLYLNRTSLNKYISVFLNLFMSVFMYPHLFLHLGMRVFTCPCMQMSWGGPNLIVKQDWSRRGARQNRLVLLSLKENILLISCLSSHWPLN